MHPMRFLGFIQDTEVDSYIDDDLVCLLMCLNNGWDNQEVWIRDLPQAYEIAVVIRPSSFVPVLVPGLDRQSIEMLIKCDDLLNSFRTRRFLVGEIQPGDLARYVLVTLKKNDTVIK